MEAGRSGSGSWRGGPGTNSPGQLSGSPTLRAMLMRAYHLKSYQISGPAWMDTERYAIAAKVPAGTSQEEVSMMLQALLAERFQLAAHRETKELPICELVVGKSGSKLRESRPDDPNDSAKPTAPRLTMGANGYPEIAPGTQLGRSYEVVVAGTDGVVHKLWARRETMQQLADRLSGQLSREVADKTELKKQYDFELSWGIEDAGGGVARTDPPPDEIEQRGTAVIVDPGLSVLVAVQEQLGLRLEQKKGPIGMLIVDKVEKDPTGN